MAEPTRQPISDSVREMRIDTLFGTEVVKKEAHEKVTITLTVHTYRSGYETRLKTWLKQGLRTHGIRVDSFDKVE